jgi:L-iditol 2-dehydrogenase
MLTLTAGFAKINVITSFRYVDTWPVVIRAIANNVYGDVSKLITHRFPLEQGDQAFNKLVDRTAGAIKVMVCFKSS